MKSYLIHTLKRSILQSYVISFERIRKSSMTKIFSILRSRTWGVLLLKLLFMEKTATADGHTDATILEEWNTKTHLLHLSFRLKIEPGTSDSFCSMKQFPFRWTDSKVAQRNGNTNFVQSTDLTQHAQPGQLHLFRQRQLQGVLGIPLSISNFLCFHAVFEDNWLNYKVGTLTHL